MVANGGERVAAQRHAESAREPIAARGRGGSPPARLHGARGRELAWRAPPDEGGRRGTGLGSGERNVVFPRVHFDIELCELLTGHAQLVLERFQLIGTRPRRGVVGERVVHGQA